MGYVALLLALLFYVYAVAAVPLGLVTLVSAMLPPQDRWPSRWQFDLRKMSFRHKA